METFCLITVVLVCVYAIVYNIGVKGASCKSKVKLHGKTAIVTGKF